MNEKRSKKPIKQETSERNAFRPSSDLELWSVLQKLLAFEEPASKRSQLRKALKKQSKPARAQTRSGEGNGWSLDEQAIFFLQTFGCSPESTEFEANRVVNELLFFEDLKRFNQIAFDTWWKSESSNSAAPESASILNDLDLSASERHWLHHAELSAPDWHLAYREGPWQDDPRVKFVKRFLSTRELKSVDFSSPLASLDSPALTVWHKCLEEQRAQLPGDFLPRMIVLVEGQTEALLLPAFARLLKTDLNALAVNIEACGGAQQVVRHYLNLKELTVLPIFCVLDSDVQESSEIIEDSLRESDRLLTISRGEIEDTFSDATFLRLIDLYLRRRGYLEPFTFEDLSSRSHSRMEILDRKFKSRGWGSFDKIGFAKLVAENLVAEDIPMDGKAIIKTITGIHDAGVRLRFQ